MEKEKLKSLTLWEEQVRTHARDPRRNLSSLYVLPRNNAGRLPQDESTGQF